MAQLFLVVFISHRHPEIGRYQALVDEFNDRKDEGARKLRLVTIVYKDELGVTHFNTIANKLLKNFEIPKEISDETTAMMIMPPSGLASRFESKGWQVAASGDKSGSVGILPLLQQVLAKNPSSYDASQRHPSEVQPRLDLDAMNKAFIRDGFYIEPQLCDSIYRSSGSNARASKSDNDEATETNLEGLSITLDTGIADASGRVAPLLRIVTAAADDTIPDPWLVAEKPNVANRAILRLVDSDSSAPLKLKNLDGWQPKTGEMTASKHLVERVAKVLAAISGQSTINVQVMHGMSISRIRWECLDSSLMNRLVNALVNEVLDGNRPVCAWRTSFITPLEALPRSPQSLLTEFEKGSKNSQAISEVPLAAETKAYFLPELDLLVGQVRRSFEIRPEAAKFELRRGSYGQSLDVKLNALRLHFSETDSCLLEWEIGEAAPAGNENQVWWKQLFHREPLGLRPLAQVIDLNAGLRFNGLTYEQKEKNADGEDVPLQVKLMNLRGDGAETNVEWKSGNENPPLGAIVKSMLTYLFPGIGEGSWHLLFDDRARVFTSIVLEGTRPQTDAAQKNLDVALSQINMVDGWSRDTHYDSSWSDKELDESLYRRFEGSGSYYMATDHSMSYVGFKGIDAKSGSGDEYAFALKSIHARHMTGPYSLLFRHFLFGESMLRVLARRFYNLDRVVRESGGKLKRQQLEDISFLRSDLATISGRIRQPNLSTQMQGRELTEHLVRRFHLEAEWESLEQKVVSLESIVHAQSERRRSRFADALNIWALPAAVYTFFWSSRPEKPEEGSNIVWWAIEQLEWFVDRVSCNVFSGAMFESLICLGLAGLVAFGVWHWRKWKS